MTLSLKNLAPKDVKEQSDQEKFLKGYEEGYRAGRADMYMGREEPSKIALTSPIPGRARGYNDGYYGRENYAEKLKEAGNAAAPYSPSVHYSGRGYHSGGGGSHKNIY